MAQDDAKQALLSDAPEASRGIDEKNAIQRRRRPTNFNWPEQNATQPLPSDESIYTKQSFSLRKVMILLSAYLGAGTLSFFLIRHQIEGKKTNGIIDAIYFCVVTMSTVGYGDLVPHSMLAKLLGCIYVFTGMALVGLFLSNAADRIVENQEFLLLRAMNMHQTSAPAEIMERLETHKLKYKFVMAALILLVLIIVGIVFLSKVENMEFMDAFYCVCCTITTLGYGDESFSTEAGRVFAVFWILSSTICLAQCFLYLAELYTEKRQRKLVKYVLSRKLTFSDLEAADLDHDKAVSAAEFILYKLKEMEKISEKDILTLMENFQKLDADHSGTLTEADLMVSQ